MYRFLCNPSAILPIAIIMTPVLAVNKQTIMKLGKVELFILQTDCILDGDESTTVLHVPALE